MKVSHEAIAVAAYFLWEKAGRPHGHDVELWLKAEREQDWSKCRYLLHAWHPNLHGY